jgi:hypothetical protein
MQLRMWTYDLAREQAPEMDHLRRLLNLTLESGYNAIGLYLEHRFAYPSAPWAQGTGCLTPEMARRLQEEFRELQIVPCINLLGHMEGMLYTEEGCRFAEERFKGMQADPTNPEFVELARSLVRDTIDVFGSELIHIGGDETWQLGVGEGSRKRVAEYEASGQTDGKAMLYGNHFGPLARMVVEAGRTPAVWGDMFFDHPDALALMPRETVIFDWQYFRSPQFTSRRFMEAGHRVVFCPAIHTYNAAWCHLPQSEKNVTEHAQSAQRLGAYGVCVTTWEFGLFGNYETILPAIRASGKILSESTVGTRKRWYETTALKVDPRGDYQGEDEEPSVAAGTCTTILTHFLTDDWDRLEIVPGLSECLFTAFPGRRDVGRMPAYEWGSVSNHLLLRAGMNLARKASPQTGVVTGEMGGERFQLRLDSHPTPHGLSIAIQLNASLDDPGFPLQGQGGPDAVARYREVTDAPEFLKAYQEAGEDYGEWARLMGVELQSAGGQFAFGGIRSALKCRFLLYSNPFLLWLHHREELCGTVGDRALEIAERSLAYAPDASTRGVSQFLRKAVEAVRYMEAAHQAYARRDVGASVNALAPLRQVFDDLEKVASATRLNIGGSMADPERCRAAREHVERVMLRIRKYGDGSLGYLPSFEYLTHPKFVPYDQAAWWLINRWANE